MGFEINIMLGVWFSCESRVTNLARRNRTLGKSVGFYEYTHTQANKYYVVVPRLFTF